MRFDDLLRLAVSEGASDLHISTGSHPMLRSNGVLSPIAGEQIVSAREVEEILRNLLDQTRWEMFLRDRELDFSYAIASLARVRINACFERGNISLACRLLPFKILSIEELGLPSLCKELATKPRGMLLVTGPTGTGKSTTLAAIIEYMNENLNRRIITIEDPIEFVYENKKSIIIQRELGTDTLSFQAALKHVLRQDPNVILIGELRDIDTISVALTASETGHLVLSTLHTVNAAQTIDRIVDVFPASNQQQVRLQLSMVLEGVISQVLLPRADGKGRIAAFEIMVANYAIRNLIREGKTFQIPNFLQMGRQQGMQTLDQALEELVTSKLITPQVALSKAIHPEELAQSLKNHQG